MKTLLPRFRPFTVWAGPTTGKRKAGAFPVEYITAIDDIIRELVYLDASDVIISTGHAASEIRFDGWPRASAKKPWHPGVVIYFDSKVGRLSFACDTYDTWQANLRSIGLTMEALRALDSNKATTTGAQYKIYRALPPPEPGQTVDSKGQADQADQSGRSGQTAPPPKTPREKAARLLLETAAYPVTVKNLSAMLNNPSERERIWRAAVKAAHPDRNAGEGHEEFLAVQAAYELLCR